jgi:hypothetical protein
VDGDGGEGRGEQGGGKEERIGDGWMEGYLDRERKIKRFFDDRHFLLPHINIKP